VSTPVVRLRNAVVVSQGFPLLSGVTLDIAEQSLTVLTGSNGAGKTSLLRLLGGLVSLTSGEGTVCGLELDPAHRRALRRSVGWLGHEGSFYGELTVAENLTFAARALNRPTDVIPAALERVDLSHRAQTTTRQLSAGQRRRLGLAWLLVRRPALWLLDEPYASLDEHGRRFLDDMLGEVVAGGASVVLSAHDPLQSPTLRPAIVRLAGGRVVPS
jgi:heme exporter protein A